MTSLRERLRRLPASVLDAGLAVALAVANTIGIRVALAPGARPDAVAYACGLIIAGLALDVAACFEAIPHDRLVQAVEEWCAAPGRRPNARLRR